MGFILWIVMVCVTATIVRELIKNPEERAAFANEFRAAPLKTTFLMIVGGAWLVLIPSVFMPSLGTTEILNTGWEIWEVSAVIALGGGLSCFFFLDG